MIFTACLNGFGTVDLFQHHDPRQMMGESHLSHGKLKICCRLYSGSNAEGGTYQKAEVAFAAELYTFKLFRQLFRGEVFSLGCQHAEKCALGDF